MGKLITFSELKENEGHLVPWYFEDAYYSGYSNNDRGYKFKWPSDHFPHCVGIHDDEIKTNKPIIRKWIEQCIDGTVIYSYISKSYRVWWSSDKDKRDWDHTSEINNNWNLFNFEDSESALAFSLRFSDLVKEVTDDHPTKHYGERYVR